tara:strand:+ start:5361 stop:5576 length:216 start_codon:yes stop_codon:yes gene_type:complete
MLNKNALKITIAIIRQLMPIIIRLLKQVEEARDPDSDGGKRITKQERWDIAYNASVVFLPEIVDAIADSIN